MRTTAMMTVYLTIPELKEAVAMYIRDHRAPVPEGMYAHLMNNEWSMDWTSDGEELAISIDGEFKDE